MVDAGVVVKRRRFVDEADRALWLAQLLMLLGALFCVAMSRLRLLEVEDPVWGEKRKADLREAWDRHCEAMEGREVAAIASGRRDGLRALDPLSVLGGGSERPRIGAGT